MICLCGKEYKHSSSYYRHKRTCNTTDKCTTSDKPDITADNPSLVVELLKQNQEFKDIIVKESSEMRKLFFKMTGKHYTNNV